MPEESENLRTLIRRYPRLFHGASPQVPSHVEPGWFPIVDSLCSAIDQLLDDDQAAAFCVAQIKEKLGGLRFYFCFRNDVAEDALRDPVGVLVARAEKACSVTCARCGEEGRLRGTTRGISTLCDQHLAKLDASIPNAPIR